MIQVCKTTTRTLELTIGRMGYIGFVIPWVYHFLSRLRSLLVHAQNRRVTNIDKKICKELWIDAIDFRQAKNGINMNLLSFSTPDCVYYSDSCPAGLGGYSNQRNAWQFKVPHKLKF